MMVEIHGINIDLDTIIGFRFKRTDKCGTEMEVIETNGSKIIELKCSYGEASSFKQDLEYLIIKWRDLKTQVKQVQKWDGEI